jgi:hypothetical protein
LAVPAGANGCPPFPRRTAAVRRKIVVRKIVVAVCLRAPIGQYRIRAAGPGRSVIVLDPDITGVLGRLKADHGTVCSPRKQRLSRLAQPGKSGNSSGDGILLSLL